MAREIPLSITTCEKGLVPCLWTRIVCGPLMLQQAAVLTTFRIMRTPRMIECIAGPRPKTRADLGRAGVLGELGYGAVNVRKL